MTAPDLVCPQGHRWEPATPAAPPPACPVCGEALAAAARGGEPLTLPPRGAEPPPDDAGLCGPVGGYEVLGRLGRGGMGVVYRARQVGLNRLVALKMVLAGAHAGPQEQARFRLEAEAAARLTHPNIVPIYEVGEHQGCPFFSMELLEGGSLAERLDGTPWRSRRAAGFVATLAEAVHAAHARGIIHRDLKPANILLAADGTPKVTDFGLAKRLDGDSGEKRLTLTHNFALVGTPAYMAPEQAEGAPEVGPAADVYSLGAVLYHLLTGRPPFQAGTALDTVLRLLEDEPVPPREINPKAARDLEAICLKCLAKDPARRYATARELAADLDRYLAHEAVAARALGRWERMRWWARQRPALATTLLVLGLFYTNHLLLLLLKAPGEGGFYHGFVTALMLVWAAGATGFQRLARRPRWESAAAFGWAGMDVVLFTALLLAQGGPASPLTPGYHLLIAVSALRFQPRLVWFLTELCLLSYAGLVVSGPWGRPQGPAVPAQTPVVFALSLLLMGLVMSLLLRRVRAAVSGRRHPGVPEG